MKKLLSLLLTAMIGLGCLSLSAQQMNVSIVADGTETNSQLPFYGLWGDEVQHNQVIYNEGLMSDLIGSEIYGMTFYATSPATWSGQVFTIKLGVTSTSQFTTPLYVNTAFTTVYTGALSLVNNDTMYIEFDAPFTYDGGNLVFDLSSTSGSWNSSTFYGISSAGGSLYAYGSSGPYVQDFIPKTKIYFTGGASCLSPQVSEVSNVTSNSAIFTWNPRADETSWEILVAPVGADITDSVWIYVTDTSYTFTGLAPNTLYAAYVRSVCNSETSGAMSVSFTTDCDQEAIPFLQNFDSSTPGSIPNCWSAIPSNSGYPYVYGYNAYSGSYDLYNYQSTSSYNYNPDGFIILPRLDTTVALNTLFLRFMYYTYGYGTMTIGAMVDPADTATFTPVQTFTFNNDVTDYIELETSFANYNGPAHYIAIRTQTTDYLTSYYDDFLVAPIPNCDRPTAIAIDSITATEVFFNWTPSNSTSAWQVAIAPLSENPDESTLDWVSTTDTNHTFDNLNADMLYRIYVRTNCGDEFSETRTTDFRTACAVIPAPYSESFVGFNTNPSPCWTRYNGIANANVTYTSSLTPSDYGWYYFDGTNSVFGAGHPYCNVYGEYFQYWLVSPAIDLSQMTEPVLNFELALMTYSGGNHVTAGGQPDDIFMVVISTDDGASWSTANATIWSNTPAGNRVFDDISNMPTDIYIPLSQYGDSTIRIAFYAESTESNGDNYLRFNNVNVIEAPECLRPETISLVSVAIDEATVTWDADEEANVSWEVAYGVNGFNPDTVDAALANTNQYSFYNLTPNTGYQVYVRTVCEDNSVTPWSNPFSFMTIGGLPAELPYFCGFEDEVENAEWTIVNGLNSNQWFVGADSSAVATGDSALYISNNQGVTNSYAISSASNVWAYRDITFPDDAVEFHISFDWKSYGESCCDYMKVYIGDPAPVYAGVADAPNGSVQVGDVFNNETTWQTATLVLGSSVSGTTKRLYFLWHNDGSVGTNPPASVDNITITAVECARPTGIAVSNTTTNSTTITLTPATENDSEWEVVFVSDTVITLTTQTLTFDMTNLSPAMAYTVYARTLCNNGDTSEYSLPTTFSTECALISSLPVFWDLETNNIGGTVSYPLPACWIRQTSTYPYSYNYSSYAHSGNYSLYFYNNMNRIVSLTEIDTTVLNINDMQISFYAALSSSYYGSSSIVVGVMSDPIDVNTFTPVDTVLVSSIYYPVAPFDVSFDTFTGNGSFIALMNLPGSMDNYGALLVDDITLEEIPLCSRPKELEAVADMNSASLSWTSNATAFIVYYKQTGTAVWQSLTGVTTTSATLSGLTPGTSYDWYVETDCADGNNLTSVTYTFITPLCTTSNQCTYTFNLYDTYGDGWNGGYLTVKQNGVPVAIVELSAGSSLSVPVSLCHGDSVVVEWIAGSYADEASFVVLNPDGSTLYTSPSMDNYSTPFVFFNDCGFGPVVTEPTVTTAPATDIAQTSVTLNGTITNPDNVTITAQGFEWKLSGDATYNVVNATGNVMTYNLSNLTENTTYTYRAFITFNGSTQYGNDEIFTTLSQGQLTEPSATTAAATSVTQTTAILNGSISNPDNVAITAKGFEWKTTTGGDFAPVTVTGDNLTYNLTGLTANTGYTYKAFITFNGTTVYGNEVTFTTLPEDVEPCNTPTGLTVGTVTHESIAISWNTDANVNSWNIQYRPVGGTLSSATANTNSYVITGLNPETEYQIQVQADCGDGNVSDWTAYVTATTLTGINNYLLNSISLYPNPAKEVVNVQCTMNNVQIESIEVFDVYGKLINTVNMTPETTTINVSNLAAGMYFVRVTTEQGVATKSFVKK